MNFLNMLEGYKPYEGIVKNLDNTPISVAGVVDSAQPQLIAELFARTGGRALVVTYSDMESRQIADALRMYTDNVAVFPEKEYVFYNIESMDRANANARLSVLDRLVTGEKIIVTASVPALMSYTAERERFTRGITELDTGGICDINKLAEALIGIGYRREDMIEGPGQFSVRGGIIDIYSPGSELPVRVELWDDEIDSIRRFDPETQRAVENIEHAHIIPVREALYTKKQRDELLLELDRRLKAARKREPDGEYTKNLAADTEAFCEKMHFPAIDKYIPLIYGKIPSLLDYFSDKDLAFVIDPKRACERASEFELEASETVAELKKKYLLGAERTALYRTGRETLSALADMRLIALEILSHTKNEFTFRHLETFTTKTVVSFHGKLEYLYEDLASWQKNNYTAVVLAATRTRAENLCGVFNERGIRSRISSDGNFNKGETVVVLASRAGGFEYPELKLAVVSEKEIFEARRSRDRRRRENADRIKSYNDITPGDYVVHAAHGVGVYDGLIKMTVDGVAKDYLKICYHGTDVLYVPIDQLELLHKYSGGGDEDKPVKVNKLGTQEWMRAKAKVKASTDELAKELVKLYAERGQAKGFAFSEDTPWQRDFEDTFEYIETSDQLRSIEEVKADMEKPQPMDRLLCGDVGFGKTEIALRAAFKAVCDSKQVAYLCPTTVLAMQHYETFRSRMADFPVTVEMLSRFRTKGQQAETIKKLRDGRADIVIGTHRLLSKDVRFKDLGLLIVDEEQRFGVAHKEKLKELKTNVDVLTMTATPIPRTLHLSMTSVRDMSVLSQPPHNRYPVRTYVLEYNEAVTDEAIRRELARGGQVFYLYNRVQGIYHKAQMLKNRFPDAEIAVGHGKLSENELEDIMYDMVTGRTQILVCTTIIETGLDIPNANTIIIENADKMGLAQLYQLRGRVGRSNRAAYAYLTYQRDKVLSAVSQKRLSAIREFTEFGSGFRIAMRDLEIRGAGNILGAEQHGHMDNVGYDMYCRILKESIDEARGVAPAQEDVTLDISVNAFIPESYIPSASQRIDMYKKIAAIGNEADEREIMDELIDRYGEPPRSVQNIVAVAALKAPARAAGCREITQKGGVVTLTFAPDKLTSSIVFGLDGSYTGRVKVISGDTPKLRVTMRDKDRNALAFITKLLVDIEAMA